MVGGANQAWAYKVTYHILTMPFTTEDKDGEQGYKPTTNPNRQNIRVEAFYVEVEETSPTVGLPSQYISPLAHKFRYYEGTTTSESGKVSTSASRVQIYEYNNTTYYTYTINGTTNNANVSGADDYPTGYQEEPTLLDSYTGPLLKPGSAITEDCHIYVTYEYNAANTVLDLTGNKSYNIRLGNRFLAFNKTRANRPAAILENNVTEENLNSNDFTYVATPGFNSNQHHWFHFRFKFKGPEPNTHDPYNITILTAYEGDETFFSDTNKNLGEKTIVRKTYKDSHLFCKGVANGSNNMWLSSDYDMQFTQTNKDGPVTWISQPGYYRGGVNNTSEMSPIWNSFAILPAAGGGSGYVFMGTKINGNGNNWQPNGGKYFFLTGNVDSGNNPRLQLKTHSGAESTPEEPYEVRTYTYKVKTPLSDTPLEATIDMTEFKGSATLLTHVPDKLKRKYVTFTGAYKSELYTDANAITTFDDAEANGRVIWLTYESSEMPFETLPKDGSYEDARWYTIRMNGGTENKNLAYHDTNNFITANGSGTPKGSNSDLHQGENSAEAMVAFIGDPFELKIISRKASETDNANRYIGCATDAANNTTLNTNKTGSSDISSWEIVADNEDGSMVLRQMGTYDSPKYIGWNSGATNKPVVYSTSAYTTANRIKVVALDQKKYLYHIVRSDGSIAVEASTMQDVGQPLNKYTHIPEIIRTPFLNPALGYSPTISFYYTKANADASSSAQNHAPYEQEAGTSDGVFANIYVRYSFGRDLPSKNYNVRLNREYIYYDSSNEDASEISSQTSDPPSSESDDPNKDNYSWYLDLSDPYAMTIKNVGYGVNGKYVNVSSWTDGAVLDWSDDTPSKFVVKSSTSPGVYEVMAATGEGVNAATTYYNIGRNTANTVRMYSNSTYHHGDDQLRFVLTETNATPVDYHLIDKENHELMVVRSRRSDLTFPADYHSPLVETYHYWTDRACSVAVSNWGDQEHENLTPIEGVKHIYVTYDTSNRINLRKGALYLLKFRNGDSFRQENGADGLTTNAVPAVYPYCNGDCNFFIYGEDEYELQQHGAASTRTRWAWYLESTNNDPYHVKICSRQEETYNTYQRQAYFYTFVKDWGEGDKVVTSLAWPGITGVQGTEYMVLGSVGQYQLVTSPVDKNGDGDYDDADERVYHTVKSFEQYWKTYDTIKNKLLKDILEDDDKGTNPEGSSTVPTDPVAYRELLTDTYGFHSYPYYAYAKRFNGYNSEGKASKGWEEIEHWYQTVNMGEGYFDFVPTVIAPVLILLDQHGWEIMRKPLPSGPDDKEKTQKYKAIMQYNSPMVKEYSFWAGAKKRTGFHQYYDLSKRVGGDDFTSSSLDDLPPYGSANVLDAKGNLQDQYVTYTVKEEYVQSYSYDATTGIGTGQPFLIQQGESFAFTGGSAIATYTVPSSGGMSKWIVENISAPIANGYLWYLKPNVNIDTEMGYGGYAHDWVNDYDDKDKVKTSGFNSWAFDPYNIQISSAADPSSYFVTNATGATLEEGDGAILGTYANDDNPAISLGAQRTNVRGTWYDSRTLYVTNATFMAVQDADGNMQLMPRFDQSRRIRSFSTLVTPTADAGDPTKLTQTHTKIYRPIVYNYHIIDNAGNESLRYKSGGDLVPQTPDHFKSPLAKDFTYYKTLTDGVVSDEITESLAGVGLNSTAAAGNDVYVRYAYDEHADVMDILKGKWFTMKLNTKDTKYDDGIKQGTSKPAVIDGDDKEWQWKFLETPLSDPDPYAVQLFNRDYNETRQNEPLLNTRFALLSHASDGYALAKAGRGDYTYQFLNGSGMNASTPATIAEDKDGSNASGFTSTSCTFHGTDSQIELFDDVLHTYIYKVYTYDNVPAIEAEQSQGEALDNELIPVLPDAAKSPLLNMEDFRYYYNNDMFTSGATMTVTEPIHEQFPELTVGQVVPDTIGKQLKYIYGLYDDVIHVHYMPYNPNNSSYLVPNVKGIEDGHVARGSGSHDAALGLDGNLLYNIIWYNDNMMFKDGNDVKGKQGQVLTATPTSYVWTLEGNDPYAIKIKNYDGTNDYINSSGGISSEAQTFMLIPWEGYGYGVLAKTGDKTKKLTMNTDDNDSTTDESVSVATTDSPTKFIFFGLATHKLIYHLVIAKTYYDDAESHGADETETIPYWNGTEITNIPIKGSTQRDLTSDNGGEGALPGEKYQLGSTINGQTYSYDAGIISLGDKLEVPSVFYRPNVVYQYFVEGVYDDETCKSPIIDMNTKYKGREVTNLGDDPGLLNRTVRINIVYSFNGSLETNAGADFVRSVDQNKWYTFEAKKADGTPQLMQFTNAWGMEVKEGRGTHYTNDYLWTPLGDPYGFVMYHRYTCVNSGTDNTGEPDRVMTTAGFSEGREVWMDDGSSTGANKVSIETDAETAAANSIYELLADEGTEPGYFKIHPVANNSGTQYYLKIVHDKESPSSEVWHDYVRLSATGHTEFTYGLTEELLKPYYDRAGYVGGLTAAGKTAYEAANGNLMTLQSVVYDPRNIVKYEPGYYRLHSPEDIEVDGTPLLPVRYASGYTHKIELDPDGNGDNVDALPMHFYEVEGASSAFNLLKSKDGVSRDEGYTSSHATQGDIPIPAVEYDPASIFYFYEGSADHPISRIQTQGLYLKGSKGPGATEDVDERAKVIMIDTENPATNATPLYVMDIGGAILLIHDNQTDNSRVNLKYLSYDQNDPDHIYDLKLTHNTHTDHAKWLMQPANHLGLRVTTHSGGDGGTYGGTTYNYTTFYAPFDALLPDTVMKDGQIETIYHAVVLETANSPWSPPNDLHPKSIGRYNIADNGLTSLKDGERELCLTNDRFIPAGTPVLIAMHDNAGYVKLTLPNSSPHPMHSTFTADTRRKPGDENKDTKGERTNILTGQYLEQKLSLSSTERIYAFGLPYSGTMTLDESTGYITATLPLQDNSGMGFYLNANPDKELGLSRGDWLRNNWYVYNNKAYYHATGVNPSREKPGIDFIPVIFDDEDEEPGIEENGGTADYPTGIYDLLGRKVATEQQVKDGTWHERLAPGIYIMNGKKFRW